MTQVSLIEKHLKRYNKGPGITVAKLVSLTGFPQASIYRSVYDLRIKKKLPISTNTRLVNGQRQKFYRLGDTTA